ncbi:PREDICTED: uncharacterized protein LOC105519652 [Colobus angolensis palliatus]|uniref:uncharacterized protein LOC105519652 n=1 Tax=Colobus angolensis palliatus TaxID=336983 RepID=UPI0005F42A51|nr:PREDICTED: uncharacterized protein LOC105519652 [Colobus angolensis palliatus]
MFTAQFLGRWSHQPLPVLEAGSARGRCQQDRFFFLRALSLACGWQPSPRTVFSLLMPKVTEDPATIACSPWKPLDSSVMSPVMQQPRPPSDGLNSWSSSNSSVLETCQPPSTFQPPSASLE